MSPNALLNRLHVVFLLNLVILYEHTLKPTFSQLMGSERTMEQFLDRLLHESVYDRRIRPFYKDSKSKVSCFM